MERPANPMRDLLSEGSPMFALLRRAHRSYLSWHELLASHPADGPDPNETWEALQLVAHSVGIDFPIPDLGDNRYWYLRTHEIADLTSQIQCMCREDADLYRALTSVSSRRASSAALTVQI